jgi:hypothetical protein
VDSVAGYKRLPAQRGMMPQWRWVDEQADEKLPLFGTLVVDTGRVAISNGRKPMKMRGERNHAFPLASPDMARMSFSASLADPEAITSDARWRLGLYGAVRGGVE